MSYDHPGRNTEEYVQILTALLARRDRRLRRRPTGLRTPRARRAAAAPGAGAGRRRSDRGCCAWPASIADGTVLWMAPARRSSPTSRRRSSAAAAAAGRPAPRIVAGLPVAVHDDEAEARAAAAALARRSTRGMANYQRILEIGGADDPADAAIVGDEASVRAQLQSLLDAGATDIWAAVFPVGDDRQGVTCDARRSCCKELVPEESERSADATKNEARMASPRRVGAETSKTRDASSTASSG